MLIDYKNTKQSGYLLYDTIIINQMSADPENQNSKCHRFAVPEKLRSY